MKIVFFVSEDWYFLSHRLPLALKIQELNWDVVLVSHFNDKRKEIEDYGIECIDLDIKRGGINIFKDVASVYRLVQILRIIRPDLIHNFSMKPILYGSFSSFFLSPSTIVFNTFTGLGHLYSAKAWWHKITRWLIHFLFRRLFKRRNLHVIFQNTDDQKLFISQRIVDSSKAHLVRGSGVDPSLFFPDKAVTDARPQVVLISRMLWSKGVADFVEAADILRGKGINADFCLVGKPDHDNPQSVPLQSLKDWDASGVIKYLGHSTSVAVNYQKACIAVLPTHYREGVPKTLLEAASCGVPMVTYDVPGCRDIVLHEKTGLVVPLGNTQHLATAIEHLLKHESLRIRYGQNARALVLEKFSDDTYIKGSIALYTQAIGEAG